MHPFDVPSHKQFTLIEQCANLYISKYLLPLQVRRLLKSEMHFVRHALTDVLISLAIMTSGADALMAQTSTPVNQLGGG